MLPDDPRHGLYAGYQAGCRTECCRAAARDYQRQRYFDRAVLNLGPRCVDKTGSVRRIHALQALGWSAEYLSARLGYSRAYLKGAINRPSPRGIHQDTAQLIVDLYEELSMTLPPETMCTARQRNMARRKGWLPPLAWDDIDDPHEKPARLAAESRRWTVDEVVVERFLTGDHHLTLNVAERREVVRRWPGSHGQLERMTGWNVTRYIENREEGAA